MKEEEIRNRDSFDRFLALADKDASVFFADHSDFEFIVCPGCLKDETCFQFEKAGFSYVLCNQCETLFANPRPSSKKLKEFYEHSESSEFFSRDFFEPMAEARRQKVFLPRVEYVVNKFQNRNISMIGDIGAGFGIFLEELKKRWPGTCTVAIEPSFDMAERCRNKKLEVIPITLEEIEGWDSRFDLLVSFELMEHIQNPVNFIRQVRRLLKPGGHFFLTTLNGQGFDIQVLWEKSKSVSPPHHLNFFNPESLSRLLEREGFVIEEISTPGKLDWDIVEGMALRDGQEVGRFWDSVIHKGSQQAKQELQLWIEKHHFSSHMRLLAKKSDA